MPFMQDARRQWQIKRPPAPGLQYPPYPECTVRQYLNVIRLPGFVQSVITVTIPNISIKVPTGRGAS